MQKRRVLLAGESWVSAATHVKGFDQFHTATYHTGAGPFLACFQETDVAVEHMAAHDCATDFPDSMEALRLYDIIILSDIGANTLLLPPAVWLSGKPVPNRLKLLRQWVFEGGGLMMIGGYLSYQGIDGKARWRGTAVEQVLPVACLPYDDRIEVPEGFRAETTSPQHPLLLGVSPDWPLLLGVNEVTVRERPDCEVLVRLPEGEGGHPLLVSGQWGEGRTLAWMSDIGPHWAPTEFMEWPGYGTLWRNAVQWLAKSDR